jgi:predicted RNA-binding Zn ribbon-like protein
MTSPHSFRFDGGRLSLNLAATLRIHTSAPEDQLAPRGAAGRWLVAASLTDGELLLSSNEEAEIRALREAVWAIIGAARSQQPLLGEYVAMLNRMARAEPPAPWLDRTTGHATLIANDPFKAALSLIARDAIDLVSGSALQHVKICARDSCKMLFFDESHSSRRRWCSMDRCGSRAKGVIFRQRRKLVAQRY